MATAAPSPDRSRIGGLTLRIHLTAPGTPLNFRNLTSLRAKIRTMVLLAPIAPVEQRKGESDPAIQYLPSYPLGRARSASLRELPSHLSISHADLFKHGIADATIYHGTSVASATTTIDSRKIIIQSSNTVAINGRGWYFSGNLGLPLGYANRLSNVKGTIIAAVIDKRARVIDWNQAKRHPYCQGLLDRYGERDIQDGPKKTFDHLARIGVDVILNCGDVVVVNLEAISVPRTIGALGDYWREHAERPAAYWSDRYDAYKLLRNLAKSGVYATKYAQIPALEQPSFRTKLVEALGSHNPQRALSFLVNETTLPVPEDIVRAVRALYQRSGLPDPDRHMLKQLQADPRFDHS